MDKDAYICVQPPIVPVSSVELPPFVQRYLQMLDWLRTPTNRGKWYALASKKIQDGLKDILLGPGKLYDLYARRELTSGTRPKWAIDAVQRKRVNPVKLAAALSECLVSPLRVGSVCF